MKELICGKFLYFFWAIVIGIATIIFVCVRYQYFKIKTMAENDSRFKKFNEQGQPIQEGVNRPVWDYSFFPEYSRLWHKGEWPQFVAAVLLVTLLTIYLFTQNQEILKLLGINFGILIGTLIKVEKD
ncbi:MAG: hypothetical protein ABIH45_06715 [Candidatus Omnitrophota bacterium]